jgi:hypothetical protein
MSSTTLAACVPVMMFAALNSSSSERRSGRETEKSQISLYGYIYRNWGVTTSSVASLSIRQAGARVRSNDRPGK